MTESRSSHRLEPTAEELAAQTAEHATELARRAEEAGRSILRLFGRRALGVPGTLLGAVQFPETRTVGTRFKDWHYWWQAHFMDCAVDASLRAHKSYQTDTAMFWYERAQQILRGIRLRNMGSFPNKFYDDMAWLTLAAGRLNALSELLRGRGDMPAQDAGRELYTALAKGISKDLGGGIFWSTSRDFKNAPANAPAALAFVRGQQQTRAADLLNWLDSSLWSAEKKLYLDGISIKDKKNPKVEAALYTYNQGPVLSALLETAESGESLNVPVLERISEILDGIEEHFTVPFELSPAETIRVLKTHGGGDGGLFTGILARYLTQLALTDAVPTALRERASALVIQTAEVLWEGRREFDPDLPMNEAGIDVTEIRGEPVVLFSTDVTRHSSETLVPGVPVELSCQLQGWMLMEAAARLFAA